MKREPRASLKDDKMCPPDVNCKHAQNVCNGHGGLRISLPMPHERTRTDNTINILFSDDNKPRRVLFSKDRFCRVRVISVGLWICYRTGGYCGATVTKLTEV